MTDRREARIPPVRPLAETARPLGPIVPRDNVAGRALAFVIAIMTFLACVTLGAVSMVSTTAATWQGQISREATIQIRPAEGLDMEAALQRARDIALGFSGVTNARIVDLEGSAKLLEPWLGVGLDLASLPVPRLVVVTIDETAPPDFVLLARTLKDEIPQSSLDDHRAWVDRLSAMARTTIVIGAAILALMVAATITTVVFATRGAMAGATQIMEVLHFVGAESRFIAGEFRRHFLQVGLRGAAAGGLVALVVFLAVGWWANANRATPEAEQAIALFGAFAVGWAFVAEVAVAVLLVGALTALTSHVTVVRQLDRIDLS
ncbi:MAG: ABC transporter permease [Rhizobiaceae bacterium]